MILRVRTVLVFWALLGLFSCGGSSVSRDDTGTGGGTGGGNTPVTIDMQLEFRDASDQPSSDLSEASPLTLITTVTDSNGDPVTSTLVTYTFQPEGLAVFGNDSGTASTNSEGVATIDILVGANSGAGQVTATLGSGETATTTFNSAGTIVGSIQPASLDLFASSLRLASSGSDEIELFALVKDANNVLLEGIDVTFSANAGASIQVTQGTTGEDGVAKAILTTQNNAENREIKVLAKTANVDDSSITVKVVGTSIAVNGPPTVILGTEAQLTISLADSDGNGIANKPVKITSKNGNQFDNGADQPTSVIERETDTEGQITVIYIANNSGIDDVEASVFSASDTPTIGNLPITIQQDQFSFTNVTSEDIELGEGNASTLELTWLKENTPYPDGVITLTTTRGTIETTSITTDAEGKASFQIYSDNAGRAVISAQGEDADNNIVNASVVVEFIATEVDKIILSASPNSIGPAGQKSTITAILLDPEGNLVKGKTVNFNAADVSGGEISPASAVTDSNGLASTVYTSLNVTKENGITITATEPESKKDEYVNLTVADRAQFISIGTGNLIESPDETSYLKKFTVFVTDANSNPVKNVELTISGTPVKRSELLDPRAEEGDANYREIRPAFFKGYWVPIPSQDDFEYWAAFRTVDCLNEDKDGDGVEDLNEDTNGDKSLTPGNIVSITGDVVTDENGQAIIELRYAKTYAAWAAIKITASTPVSGSESQTSQIFELSASAEDLRLETTPPNTNPFGSGRQGNDPNNPLGDGSNATCDNAL